MPPNKAITRVLSAKTSSGGPKLANFAPGKGRVILTDFKLIEAQNDPNTYVFEGVIKSSQGVLKDVAPNAPGEGVQALEGLSLKGGDSRAKAIILAILGPDLEKDENAAAEVAKLLREDPETGYTTKGSACPAKGVELEYWTQQRDFNGKEGTVVRFAHVPFDAATVKANLEHLKTLGK